MPETQHPPEIVVTAKAMKALKRHHPWVFSGGIRKSAAAPVSGQTVTLVSETGVPLACGAYSPKSQIRLRIWSHNPVTPIDDLFFNTALSAAIQMRNTLPLPRPCTAVRLVNAESDGLPGLIVDRYGDYLVCQFLSAGTEFWKTVIVEQLRSLVPVKGIYERSDADVREKEGLPKTNGVLWGDRPPDLVTVEIGNIRVLVDIHKGHKTGFYLDQRENQQGIAKYAKDADVLNCFSYSGVYGLWAIAAGARHVINLDASQDALDLAAENLKLNGMTAELVQANVFNQLRSYRDAGRFFDIIVLDPPKFVANAGQMIKGTRGYKDINLLALKLLKPGGKLLTFSCSGLVAPALFRKIVADAAIDAQRQVRFIELLNQAADHPIAANFPEGHYLKGVVCLVD